MDGSSGLAPGLGEFALLRFTCPGAEHRSAAGVRGKTASVPPIPLDVQACTASRERSTGTPLSHPRRRPALLAPATTHPVLVQSRRQLEGGVHFRSGRIISGVLASTARRRLLGFRAKRAATARRGNASGGTKSGTAGEPFARQPSHAR